MPLFTAPLSTSKINLNPAGVAGFYGGESAISAIHGGHRFGWYNTPGSYVLAKHFGRMGRLRFLDPKSTESAAAHHDDKKGPRFIRPWSGTTTHAGNLARLTMETSRRVHEEIIFGRETNPVSVGYLNVKDVDHRARGSRRARLVHVLLGLVPVVVSLATCYLCSAVGDVFCCFMIALGIIFNGIAVAILGSRSTRLVLKSTPNSAPGVPHHGILIGDSEVVVVKGEPADVDTITQGNFDSKTESDVVWGTDDRYSMRTCALLFLIQFVLQLALVPQGSLFGQIMFLVSLGVSWAYNAYLASSKDKAESDAVSRMLGDSHMLRYRAGTRTTSAVFASLLLFHETERWFPEQDKALRESVLRSFFPNERPVWRRWRDKVVDQLLDVDDKSESLRCLEEDVEDWALSDNDTTLLRVLLDDARTAFRHYFRIRERLSGGIFDEKMLETRLEGPGAGIVYFKMEEI